MRPEYGSVRPWELSRFTVNEFDEVIRMIEMDDEAHEKAERAARAKTRQRKGRR